MDYTQHPKLEFRRKFFKFFGAQITVIDPTNQNPVGVIMMKAFKLKEDIRLYSDTTKSQELFHIQARSVLDFGATYDVLNPAGQAQFALRRKGFKSAFVRDHMDILDTNGGIVGACQETSSGLALIRRYVGIIPIVGDILDLAFMIVPQTYTISLTDGTVIGLIEHRKNPFVVKMDVDMSMNQNAFYHSVATAATALLSINDASKNS